MTPKEYITSKKQNDLQLLIDSSDLPEFLKYEIQKTGIPIEVFLEKLNKIDFAEYLLSLLKPQLPKELWQLFEEGYIAVGELNDRTPNAHVEKIGDEGYAIIFNTGLKEFIYRVARILSTRFQPRGKDVHIPNIEFTASLIYDVFWWFEKTEMASGPSYSIEPDQIQIANILSLEAEKFLLAHEIGHIFDMVLDHNHSLFLEQPSEIPINHREEHVADIFALSLSMDLYNPNAKRSSFMTPLTYSGVEFAIQIYCALESLGLEFNYSTHPTAESRLQFIRNHMRERCADDRMWQELTVVSSGIEGTFSSILNTFINSQEYSEFFDQGANSVFKELDTLLNECTGNFVPNYARFYSKAGEIFSRGYSYIILEKVAQIAYDFFYDIKKYEITKEKPNEANWIRFQKFKLLWAFIYQYMNEPARSIFLEKFDEYT